MSRFEGKEMRPAVKIVAINALVLFVMFNGVIWAICLATSIRNVFASEQAISRRDDLVKAKLPNYASVDWALTHFSELISLKASYVSYIEWRRKSFEGRTITITGPYGQRSTVGRADATKPSVYFFGGSTMWGTGADDAHTIPSEFAQLSGLRVDNFGETAFTAHQSLMLLIQLLQDGHRPNTVVFYDGVNEVAHKCRIELTPWSHAYEHRISSAFEERAFDLQYLVRPLMALAKDVSSALFARMRSGRSWYNCDSDPAKAQRIADNLIEDWAIARRLVESYNGKFIGVLQPVAFFSNTRLDALELDNSQRKQYQAVYPLIKAKMMDRRGLFDFTDVMDKPEYIYIDFCHVSPNGNRYVAERILKSLNDATTTN
jgi:hypothetical protein